MPNITITNVSSEKVFIRDFYLTLGPGEIATFFRSSSDLMRSQGLHALAASGDITFYLEYTADEKATRFDNFPGVGILTSDNGVAIRMINGTGADSIKGTVIEASDTTANVFAVAAADAFDPTGVVYEDGVADGAECLVVVSGIAQVLLEDSTASALDYWVRTSITQAGRADATNATPPGGTVTAIEQHLNEIGHALEAKTAGTNVLCRCMLHFN